MLSLRIILEEILEQIIHFPLKYHHLVGILKLID